MNKNFLIESRMQFCVFMKESYSRSRACHIETVNFTCFLKAFFFDEKEKMELAL